MEREISNHYVIDSFMHCNRCMNELPKDLSPREYASLEVGFTRIGLQVWCKRHECNVMHIDFQGHKHPANLNAAGGLMNVGKRKQ